MREWARRNRWEAKIEHNIRKTVSPCSIVILVRNAASCEQEILILHHCPCLGYWPYLSIAFGELKDRVDSIVGYVNNSNGPMFTLSSATTPLYRSFGHVERIGTVLRDFLDQSLLPEVNCTWKEEHIIKTYIYNIYKCELLGAGAPQC